MTYMRDETDVHLSRLRPPTRVWAGKIATNAVNFADRVSVTIVGTDGGTLRWEDVRWQPRNNSQLPKRGDVCVIVVDDNGEMWVPVWWPTQLQTGGDAEILTGTATPDEDVGRSGDFYIDTNDDIIYGPKEGDGDWPIALKGAAQVTPYVLPARLQIQTDTFSQVSDWNNARENGWYQGPPGTTNAPTATWYIGQVVSHRNDGTSADYITQRVWTFTDTSGAEYRRNNIGGGWWSWFKTFPIDDNNLPVRLFGSTAYVADLNAVYENGWYPWTNTTVGAPAIAHGYCYVQNLGPTNVLQQAYQYNSDNAWMRRKVDGGAWGAWIQTYPLVINDTNLPDRLKSVSPNYTDLNTILVNGWSYHSGNTNQPPGPETQWYVETIMWGSSGWGTQVAYSLSYEYIYRRRLVGSNWGAWVLVYPTVINDVNLPDRLKSTGTVFQGDLNTLTSNGWYRLDSNATNVPSAGMYGLLMVQTWDTGQTWTVQWCKNLFGDQEWRRWNNNGTWTAWVQMYPIPTTAVTIDDTNLPVRLRSATNPSSSVSDWNDAKTNGWHQGANAANAPQSGWIIGEVVSHDANVWVTQRVWTFTDNSGAEWRRNCLNGTWSGWWQVYPPPASAITINDTNLPPRLHTGSVVNGASSVTDANLATASGWYILPAASANKPGGSDYHLFVSAWNTSYLRQFAYHFYSDAMWMRISAGGWGAWVQTWPPPAGDTAWSNFTGFGGQYGNMGAPWGPCQFRKLSSGLVIFRGLVQTWDCVNDEVITNMPVGYRPGSVAMRWRVSTSIGDGALDMGSGGGLINQGAPQNGWISVNEVSYYAEN